MEGLSPIFPPQPNGAPMPKCIRLSLSAEEIERINIPRVARLLCTTDEHVLRVLNHKHRDNLPEEFENELCRTKNVSEAVDISRRPRLTRDMYYASILRVADWCPKDTANKEVVAA